MHFLIGCVWSFCCLRLAHRDSKQAFGPAPAGVVGAEGRPAATGAVAASTRGNWPLWAAQSPIRAGGTAEVAVRFSGAACGVLCVCEASCPVGVTP